MFRRILLAATIIAGFHASSDYAQQQVGPVPTSNGSLVNPNISGGTISGADISGANVTATGGNTARTLAIIEADTINVLDWGVKCDGLTDDTANLQSAINRGAAINAPVLIPSTTGQHCLTGQLTLPSNTNLIINGYLLLNPGGVNQHVLNAVDTFSNIYISGTGTLDGNQSNETGIGAGVEARHGANFHLSGLTITNVTAWPFNIVGVTGAWVNDVTFGNSGHSAEFAVGTNNCWADHLTGNNINDEVFSFFGGVFNCGISNSQMTGSTNGSGIDVLNSPSQTAPSHDIIISNNVTAHNSTGGITVADVGGTGQNYNVTIIGNRAYDNNTSNNSNTGDIGLNGLIGASIIGNSLGPSGSGAAATNGIVLSGSVNNLLIQDNLIMNEGVGSTLGIGITFNSAASQVIISGNRIFDNQQTPSMAFAINGTLGNYVQLIGNFLGPTISSHPDASVHNATTTVIEPASLGAAVSIGPSALMVGPLTLAQSTVALLPTCNAALKGSFNSVTDATTPTYGGTLTGGGAVSTPVYCNGTAWTPH